MHDAQRRHGDYLLVFTNRYNLFVNAPLIDNRLISVGTNDNHNLVPTTNIGTNDKHRYQRQTCRYQRVGTNT